MDQITSLRLPEKEVAVVNPRTGCPGLLELHTVSGLLVLFKGAVAKDDALAQWEQMGSECGWVIASSSLPAYMLWDGNQSSYTVFAPVAARGYVRISEVNPPHDLCA